MSHKKTESFTNVSEGFDATRELVRVSADGVFLHVENLVDRRVLAKATEPE